MNNKIKIGIIGFGGFGKFIFDALSHSEHFMVAEIADDSIDKSEIPSYIQFYENWQELASSSGTEAVIISTPPSSHFEMTVGCIRAGKHVMTEKPLTMNHNHGLTIKKVAQENKVVVMVDFLQRFNPLLEYLHRLYKQNMFGQLERYYVENYAQDEFLPESHWFWNEDVSGGILIEHAVHFIDLVHWFTNAEVETMHGFADLRNENQKDRVSAQVHYKNGVMASHYHSFTRPNAFERTQMNFIFETAQFKFNGWIPESGTFTLLGNEKTAKALNIFPDLSITSKKPVNNLPVRGKEFGYTHLMEGTFSALYTKQELYALAIKNIFEDFYKKIQQPDYTTRVNLDDAIKAVYIAENTTKNASITS